MQQTVAGDSLESQTLDARSLVNQPLGSELFDCQPLDRQILIPHPLSPESLLSRVRYTIPKIKLCLVHEGVVPENLFALKTGRDVQEFLEPLRFAPEEQFVSLHLNAKNEVIGMHEVSHGTLASSIVHPREVFKAALLANSYAIIVCHNHPSYAKVEPSPQDLQVTSKLISAANMLELNVLDHLILSPNQDYYSIRANFPDLWA